jgi:Arc/MetJ family transcription regulator
MRINVELTAQEIAALRQATTLDNDAEAVAKAAREFLRLRGLRELKAVSGKVEFEANWQELEQLELEESDFPQ